MKNAINYGVFLAPAFLFSACGTGQKEVAEKPLNIIHIMTDDHSYQTISAYGHALGKLAPTPNLDRLAAEGMLFRQAFVENSLSTPSRACLMTGLYSHQNGQRQLGKGIDTTKVFFSEILQQHGYQTGVVGNGICSVSRKVLIIIMCYGIREIIIIRSLKAKNRMASM